MWSSFLGDAEKAKERLASALEKTGELLNEKANEHSAWLKKDSEKRAAATLSENKDAQDVSNIITLESNPSPDEMETVETGEMYSSEILIEEQTDPVPILGENMPQTQMPLKQFVESKDEMLKNMKSGWGNMMNATRNTLAEAQQLFHKDPLYRDPSLPLDVDALRDAEVVYVTDRLITMGHPNMQSSIDGDITAERKLAAIGHLLKKRHADRFMVWNLSEVEYDYSVFDNEVLPFHFPGSPSPPLGMLLKLLLSVESWLKADSKNVAVFHCLTGKGRTSTVLACFLCWIGEAGFHDPVKALEYIATCKRVSHQSLTIPSQRRYASYFSNMLDGVRPHQPPLVLKRIIMSEAPPYAKPPSPRIKDMDNPDSIESKNQDFESFTNQLGCAPYLQIFKAGKLLFTTTAKASHHQDQQSELPFCVPSDGPISFPIEVVIQGDILIRCRHLSKKGKRTSMFRAAFHTGYVATTKVLRLTKGQLDGACSDRRFQEDFFLDLIFEACDSSIAGKHLVEVADGNPKTNDQEDEPSLLDSTEATAASPMTEGTQHPPKREKNISNSSSSSVGSNEANERRMLGTLSGGNPSLDSSSLASTYDSMLHRDSRFWDVIAKRRNEHFSNLHANSDQFQDGSAALAGTTVGRRRDFSNIMKNGKQNSSTNDDAADNRPSPRRASIDTFSIGDGFSDAFLTEENTNDKKQQEDEQKKKAKATKKKDSLMEALMAIDDDGAALMDELEEQDDTMVVVEENNNIDNNDDNQIIQEEISFDKSEDFDSKTGISDVSMNSEIEGTNSTEPGGKPNVSKEKGNATDLENAKNKSDTDLAKDEINNSNQGQNNDNDSNDDNDEIDFNDSLDLEDLEAVASGAYDFDDDDEDDEELEDLENFLTQKK